MAELATIARPYAEALFQAAGATASALLAPLEQLAAVAAEPALRQFAGNPAAQPAQVFELITGVAGGKLDARLTNLLRTVIDNGRLAALPEISAQFQRLVNADSGVSDATVYSAFAISDALLADVVAALEERFARKLNASVELDPTLIGGVRVVVGDEVLDTSVKARLEQMKLALTA
jgi:F-type H+-transporting ATPase subunit delta